MLAPAGKLKPMYLFHFFRVLMIEIGGVKSEWMPFFTNRKKWKKKKRVDLKLRFFSIYLANEFGDPKFFLNFLSTPKMAAIFFIVRKGN